MHEPRAATPWDAVRVREVADRIAPDTASTMEREGDWPRLSSDGLVLDVL
jgi:hypothetical protein